MTDYSNGGLGIGFATVPDSIEPITGYRIWKPGYSILRSISNPYEWTPKLNTAICHGRPWIHCIENADFANEWRTQNCPKENCHCGFWAFNDPIELQKYLKVHYKDYAYQFIGGTIKAWGKIIQHTHGFRAQYAEPISMFISPGLHFLSLHQIDTLTEKYNIPLLTEVPI